MCRNDRRNKTIRKPPAATYDLPSSKTRACIFFCLFSVRQRTKSEQQLGPAVRVHVPGPGTDEGQTGADESVDFIPETAVPLMIVCPRATLVGPSEGCIHTRIFGRKTSGDRTSERVPILRLPSHHPLSQTSGPVQLFHPPTVPYLTVSRRRERKPVRPTSFGQNQNFKPTGRPYPLKRTASQRYLYEFLVSYMNRR